MNQARTPSGPGLVVCVHNALHHFKTVALAGVLALTVMVSMPATARAWGCDGHQIIALLAEDNLTPHALAAVKQILIAHPIDPALSRWCRQAGEDPIADGSTWPDDVRSRRPETAPWHYIDIPDGAPRRDLERFCADDGCVTQAIRNQLAILRKSVQAADVDSQKTAEALRFLIHFVGDEHQPMHAISNNDLGGNCDPVAFFETAPTLKNPGTDSYSPNLHSIWDVDLLARIFPNESPEQAAGRLNHEFRSKISAWKTAKLDIDGWAWESHQAAIRVAYGKLPVAIPIERPVPLKSCVGDDHVAQRRLKLDENLRQPYQLAATPLVKQQIAMAGARLALLLNQVWP